MVAQDFPGIQTGEITVRWPLTIMSVMVSMVWLMTSSASRLCPQSAAVKLRRYVWSVAMMLRRGSWGGHGKSKGDDDD